MTVGGTKPRLLDRIERIGNALPDPAVIFLALIGLLVACSMLAAALGWQVISPATGQAIRAENLLSERNLARLLTEMPRTLTSFPPLGMVLVIMLGAAVAERSGLFAALIGRAMANVPAAILTPAVFLIGVASHQASDAAYVVLIPLAAVAYAQAGRHPLLGVAVAYAGISGAFAGNLLPGQFDVLILGITESAARLIAPAYTVNALGNWWFTATLGLGLTPVAWAIADRLVEPRLGPWRVDQGAAALSAAALSALERKGLGRAGLAALAIVLIFAALVFYPDYSPLTAAGNNPDGRYGPFFQSLVAGFFLLFLASGWVFGKTVGSIKTHRDAIAMMQDGLKVMAPYIVVAFFAAHFIAMFQWSNLGPLLAVNGAAALKESGLPVTAILTMLLLFTSVIDWLIGSASAKWSAMAPVIVPMLMLQGVSPEMTTAAFRMGDSIWNIVTPVASNFILVLALAQRWQKDFGIGSLIALMLPFSLAFGACGIGLLLFWVGSGLPVGPGAPAFWGGM